MTPTLGPDALAASLVAFLRGAVATPKWLNNVAPTAHCHAGTLEIFEALRQDELDLAGSITALTGHHFAPPAAGPYELAITSIRQQDSLGSA